MVALCLLRFAIGIHFFSEGTSKYQSGNFSAEPFIRQARGPIAPYLRQMLDDQNALLRLCIDQKKIQFQSKEPVEEGDGADEGDSADEKDVDQVVNLDPYLTKSVWASFVLEANEVYDFGDEELLEKYNKKKADLMAQLRAAESAEDGGGDVGSINAELQSVNQKVDALKKQVAEAELILSSAQRQLQTFLDTNSHEILEYFGGLDRLEGFNRDGENRDQVVEYVPSLRGQYAEIRSDLDKKRNQWIVEIEKIWDGLENDINGLAIEEQQSRGPVVLSRPYQPKSSRIEFINKFIPWFDMIVGGLLIVGLFSRLASLAGGLFLLTVILTQPFWLPGSAPTFYQSIELAGLVVIFATCAGRYGGLDGIISGFGLVRRNEGEN